MRVAILSEASDAELSSEVSYINGNQDFYHLIMLPKNDPFAHVAISLDYDAMLVLDEKMMSGGVPSYNRYLHTYRDHDLSDQTMIIDYPFDSEGRIGFTFIQIAAANAKARSLMMELGLMALADFRLMTDAEFRDYYGKVDRIVQSKDDQLDPVALEEISKMREKVIIGCFLRGDRDPE
jgi:hypothetical protein